MGRADKDVAAEEAAASRRKLGLLRSLVSNGDSSASTGRKSARAGNSLRRDAPRSRPVAAGGGPASHILGWLGRPERPTSKVERQDRPERQEKAQLQMVGSRRKEVQSDTSPEAPPKKRRLSMEHQSAQATSRLMAQASAKTSRSSRLQSTKPKVPVRKRTVNALKMGEETMLRSASPCSSESPGRSSSAAKNPGVEQQGARSSSRSHSRSSRSTTPSQRARSVSINKDIDSLVEESGSTRGGFQQVVLDQLRILCKEYEGAEVLAEYIVAMVAGNKGRSDIASELEPFFKDAAQATSFAGWVEEVKVKFLTGGPLPKSSPGMVSSPQKAATSSNTSAAANSGVSFGPHVAVTKRAVLQPSPRFNADPATAVSVSAALAPQNRATSVVTSARPVVRASKLVGTSLSKPGDKKHLLENMTRQLQTILTKLNDPNMQDETREKYQALAQSVQTQMAKITRPPPPSRALPPRGRRR